MNLKCPKCGGVELSEPAPGNFHCRACLHYFQPPPEYPPAWEVEVKPAPDADTAEKIRQHAYSIVALALLFLVLAFFVTVATFCYNMGADTVSNAGYIAAAGLIWLALWLYLIGQVVHIRANTHRD